MGWPTTGEGGLERTVVRVAWATLSGSVPLEPWNRVGSVGAKVPVTVWGPALSCRGKLAVPAARGRLARLLFSSSVKVTVPLGLPLALVTLAVKTMPSRLVG